MSTDDADRDEQEFRQTVDDVLSLGKEVLQHLPEIKAILIDIRGLLTAQRALQSARAADQSPPAPTPSRNP